MLTIFSIPKSFKNSHINTIQRNAIQSWLKLRPKCEVILFGNEDGTAKVATELGLWHVPEIEINEFGTPLLNWAFNFTQKIAKNNALVYVNADIILMPDLIKSVQQINKLNNPLFLMGGRRWDLDINKEINFNKVDWEREVRYMIREKGVLHGFSGIDYFVFPKNLPHNLPDFAVGRVGWDNWLIYHIRSLRIPVIDATEAITIVHQSHGFFHSKFGDEKRKRIEGPELVKNIKLAGGFANMGTLREADWILTSQGFKKPPLSRRIFAKLSLFYPWRLILALKRKCQTWLWEK